MKGRIVLVVALLAFGAVLFPLLAVAERRELPDPNDQKGILDIKMVTRWGGDKPGWKVATFKDWKTRRIYDRGDVIVWLDTRGGERADYFAVVHSDSSGHIRARLYRDFKKKDDKRKGSLNTWRKNRHSVSVKVPLSKLNFDDERIYYAWYVQTMWTSDNCKRVCFDLAPDKGVGHIRELRPGHEPTPTPTPTGLGPTPSPSPSESPIPAPIPSESPSPTPSPSPPPTPS